MCLKKVPFEERSIDIERVKTQLTDDFRAINPTQKVPALVIGKNNGNHYLLRTTFLVSMIVQYKHKIIIGEAQLTA